ncbi:unnamed protein product, partial [Effrenium voratum]
DTEEDGADPAQAADENDSEAEAYELQDEQTDLRLLMLDLRAMLDLRLMCLCLTR